MFGINVTSPGRQSPPAYRPTAVDSAFGVDRRRLPLPANPLRRRIGDEGAALAGQNAGAEPRPTQTLLLIDDIRLRRECLFHLLSAELPDYDVLAFSTTEPAETWAAASPDIVLASSPSGDAGERLPVSEIVAAANGAPVLLLTESDGDDRAPAAEEPGVAGRFPTACGSDLLIAAIQLVLAGGQVHIPARAAAKTLGRPH